MKNIKITNEILCKIAERDTSGIWKELLDCITEKKTSHIPIVNEILEYNQSEFKGNMRLIPAVIETRKYSELGLPSLSIYKNTKFGTCKGEMYIKFYKSCYFPECIKKDILDTMLSYTEWYALNQDRLGDLMYSLRKINHKYWKYWTEHDDCGIIYKLEEAKGTHTINLIFS